MKSQSHPCQARTSVTVAGMTGSNGAIHLRTGDVQSHQAGLSPKWFCCYTQPISQDKGKTQQASCEIYAAVNVTEKVGTTHPGKHRMTRE